MAFKFNPLIFSGLDISGSSSIGIGTLLTGANPFRILLTDAASQIAQSAALTNGQLLIGSTGFAPVVASLTGTNNQVSVGVGAGSITLSLPQDIAKTSSPQFIGIDHGTLGGTFTLGGTNAAVLNLGNATSYYNFLGGDIRSSAPVLSFSTSNILSGTTASIQSCTGNASSGDSGSNTIATGTANDGSSGSINFSVGVHTGTGSAGSINFNIGNTSAAKILNTSDFKSFSTNNATAVDTGALRTNGGLSVTLDTFLGGGLKVIGTTTLSTTITGLLKATAGVVSAASAGSDYQAVIPNGTTNQIWGMNAAQNAKEWKSLSVGTTGTDFAIAHAANSIVYNLPTASATNRGALGTADFKVFTDKEPVFNGLEDPTKFSIAYVDADRKLTVTYASGAIASVGGIRFPKSVQDVSTAHADTTNTYYFYYDINGVFTVSTTVWDLLVTAPIASVYYNQTTKKGILYDERHAGVNGMDAATHKNLHLTRGTQVLTYPVLGNWAVAAPTLIGIQYSLTAATLLDEDIQKNTTQINYNANKRVYYREATTGYWAWNDADSSGILGNGTDITYNNPTGWAQTAVPSTGGGRYVNYYLVGMMSADGFGVSAVQGQATFSSLITAQSEDPSLALAGLSSLSSEYVILYRITYRRVTGTYLNCQIESVQAIRANTLTGVGGFTPSSHATLTNRSDVNQHPIGAITGTTAGYIPFQNLVNTFLTEYSGFTFDPTPTTGGLTVGNTTTSTSSTTGALVVAGGVGIGGNLNVGSTAGICASSAASTILTLGTSVITTAGANQRVVYSSQRFGSDATSNTFGVQFQLRTAAAVHTVANAYNFSASDYGLGSGSTITKQYGFSVDDLTVGAYNYGFYSAVTSGTNKYSIYTSTAQSYFGGVVTAADTTDAGAGTGSIVSSGGIYAAKDIRTAQKVVSKDGSVSAPSYVFTSESDTGFYRASGAIGLTKAGIAIGKFSSSSSDAGVQFSTAATKSSYVANDSTDSFFEIMAGTGQSNSARIKMYGSTYTTTALQNKIQWYSGSTLIGTLPSTAPTINQVLRAGASTATTLIWADSIDPQNLANSTAIMALDGSKIQKYTYQGAGANTFTYTGTPLDGMILYIINSSTGGTLTLTDATKFVLNGDWNAGFGGSIQFIYDNTIGKFVEITRNGL